MIQVVMVLAQLVSIVLDLILLEYHALLGTIAPREEILSLSSVPEAHSTSSLDKRIAPYALWVGFALLKGSACPCIVHQALYAIKRVSYFRKLCAESVTFVWVA